MGVGAFVRVAGCLLWAVWLLVWSLAYCDLVAVVMGGAASKGATRKQTPSPPPHLEE